MPRRPSARPLPLARAALAATGLGIGLTGASTGPSAPALAAGLGLVGLAAADAGLARRVARRADDHDPRTGRATAAGLRRHLERALAHGVRPAVVHVELEGVDGVRAADGDPAAEALLREAAARVGCLPPSSLVAGLDPGSVTVACDLLDGADAWAFADRVREELHRPFGDPSVAVGLVAHVGVALVPASAPDRAAVAAAPDPVAVDADALVRRAVAAASRARAADAGVAVDDAAEPAARRLSAAGAGPAVVADLRRALDERELFCVYQPVMHLASATVVALEALVRWRHPVRGVVSPGAFVAEAERHGLAPALGRWVLDEALGQVAAWCTAGTCLPVSVNVSARHLGDEAFADDVEEALARHDVPPHLLELELTETAAPADLEAAAVALRRLHRQGVNVSLDGFGTGHASLAYLEALPVDTVKIDASFVARLGRRPGDGAIVRSILALGRSLGLQVVAEGVHDERVARSLVDLGCELGQGFRWTRPLPAPDALAWTRACAASAARKLGDGGTLAGGAIG